MTELPDVTACDREPIHIPGSIQPHGMLLVVERDGLTVAQAAGDVEGRLGLDEWVGRPVADILGERLAAGLREATASSSFLGRFTSRTAEILDVSVHRLGRRLLVELEPGAEAPIPAYRLLAELEAAGTALERASALKTLCGRAAIEFRRLTGFDRVMIYRFLDDEAGAVLAEDRDESAASFLNHHFPASDIPKQARALYVRNLTRAIPDVSYVPAPLRPAGAPLDMSDCTLRSVSPVHIRYLRNMGVRASASISIVQDGTLWGLIACHHASPRLLPYEVRAGCRALAGELARRIKAMDDGEAYRDRIRLRGFEDDVVATFAQAGSMDAAITDCLPQFRRMLRADGVAVLRGASIAAEGNCPTEAEIRSLAEWVVPQAAAASFATDELSARFAPAMHYREEASGLLAVAVAIEEPFLLLWFRAEKAEIVNWAGNPHKAVALGPGEELTPRASFETWREAVRGRSRPWSVAEIEAAARLRAALLENRQQRRVRELNGQLAETLADKEMLLAQQAVLIKEVNHRVQNSLALVSSFLGMQGRASDDPALRTQLDEAQRRLGAVALVHRRLYRADQVETVDLSRYLEELCADAVSAMGEDWSRQVTYDIAPVSVPTDRAVPIGLILTELVINANKYAYGGRPGPIEIALERQRADLRLVVADRGPGKKAGSGFGTRMLNAMVRQLAGSLEYRDNRPGVRAVLTVPIAASA